MSMRGTAARAVPILTADELAQERDLARKEFNALQRTLMREHQEALHKLAEKDSTIAEQDAALQEIDAELAEKDSTIAEQDAALQEIDAKLAEKDATIAQQGAALQEKDSTIAELRRLIAQLQGNP